MSVCKCVGVANDLANRWTDMVLLYSVGTVKLIFLPPYLWYKFKIRKVGRGEEGGWKEVAIKKVLFAIALKKEHLQ